MIGNGRGFEHRTKNPEVVEKFFSKVLKISRFFRFGGHCILKNPNLSTGYYPIMGQNMGQGGFSEIPQKWLPTFRKAK